MTTELARYVNSEREPITIDRIDAGEYAGRLVLCIHDDDLLAGGSGIRAPMLLDEGTRDWLLEQLQPESLAALERAKENQK